MAACWLFKSEPGEYGIADLAAEPEQTARWDGIRNYQARNFIRDAMEPGDRVLFYHSSCRHTGVAGICEVVSPAYPDPAQFDPRSDYVDDKSTADSPRWYCVDIRLIKQFPGIIGPSRLRREQALAGMVLFRNPRLSIQPVTPQEWQTIENLAAGGGLK